MINTIPSSSAPVIAPYAPLGRTPVSQESSELKSSTFKAAEQSAESGRNLNQRSPDERPNDEVEQDRVNRRTPVVADDKQERLKQEQEQIQELAARDREVRAHEQAHAAVAGQYASSPTYTFVRGPDGASYAVEGEVNVDTSPIPGDPEATLRKAQQLRRAANAPAEPSGQDGRVAALAAQMEIEARAEIREKQAVEAEQQAILAKEDDKQQESEEARIEQQRLSQEEARLQLDEERFSNEQRQLDQRQARAELFNETSKRNIDINRKLIEIGVFNSGSSLGSFLNSNA